jgi:hypothetical protein
MHGASGTAVIRNAALLTTFSLVLSGCLSGEKSEAKADETPTDINVTGSVGDGPIVGAAMLIRSSDSQILSEFESNSFADYDIAIRVPGKNYPLIIEARDGIDLVTNLAPDFSMISAVLSPAKKATANVNPFTTFAVEIARDLPGGLTKENIQNGESIVTNWFNSGLTSLVDSGPRGTVIDESNLAEIVKASEVLAETVRRTSNLLQMFGTVTTANQVIRALSSDLGDDVVDGLGGPRTDARTAAISTVASAQILLEAMANELHVNDVDATNALNAALVTVNGTAPATTIDDINATAGMLTLVRTGLAGAFAVSDSPKLAELQQAVDGIQPGMDFMLVRSLLPDDYRATLDNILMSIAGSDISVINTINGVARNGGGEPPANRPPTISGSPRNSIAIGSNYSFVPTASDADGDTLAFSVSRRPAWANFDSSTGRLSGTPSSDDAGTYEDITISVSDGQTLTSLSSFSITVVSSNSAPTISGTPPSQVNANSAYNFTPTANDADGESLTFSVTGLPGWASFNASTGGISGTPTDANVGTYSNISITVSDTSNASATLGPFSITVNAVSLGSVTLNWTPPTQNDDGTTLTDLAGYKIYWGTTPGNYPNSVTITNAGMTSYVVDNLVPGTYEFVATSYNEAGVESVYSDPTTKVVN